MFYAAQFLKQNNRITFICRFNVEVASLGHRPQDKEHQNTSEHIKPPYKAMMYLAGDECVLEEFCGLKVKDTPSGLFW